MRKRKGSGDEYSYELAVPPWIGELTHGKLFAAELVDDGILLRPVSEGQMVAPEQLPSWLGS